MTNYSTTTYVGLLNTLRYKKQLIHSTKYLWFVIKITVHMCFTAREQAVRRRRPASYSSHIVDRRLWRRVYFFRCNREVPASDSRRRPMFTRMASSWRRYSSWYNVMFRRLWLALLLRRACQPSTSLFVRAGCLNADHAEGSHTVLSSQVRWT